MRFMLRWQSMLLGSAPSSAALQTIERHSRMVATRSGLSTGPSDGEDDFEICSRPGVIRERKARSGKRRRPLAEGSVRISTQSTGKAAEDGLEERAEAENSEGASSSGGEGEESLDGDTSGGSAAPLGPELQVDLPAAALLGEPQPAAATPSSSSSGSEADGEGGAGGSGSSSDSDSDTDSPGVAAKNPLGELAQSMWQALASDRPGLPASLGSKPRSAGESGRGRRRGASAAPPEGGGGPQLSRPHPHGGPDVDPDVAAARWRPRTRLPPPATATPASGLLTAAVAPLMAEKLKEVPRDKRRPRDKSGKRLPEPSTTPRPWHELPVTAVTEEVRRDLRLLRLRGALDPQRFYKAPERGAFPTRFQLGTVVEGPADFFSGRLPQRERGASLAEELLADARLAASRKRRFGALQAERQRTRGKVRHRKSDNPRAHRRPNKKPRH